MHRPRLLCMRLELVGKAFTMTRRWRSFVMRTDLTPSLAPMGSRSPLPRRTTFTAAQAASREGLRRPLAGESLARCSRRHRALRFSTHPVRVVHFTTTQRTPLPKLPGKIRAWVRRGRGEREPIGASEGVRSASENSQTLHHLVPIIEGHWLLGRYWPA
jgi:hypothetical protein